MLHFQKATADSQLQNQHWESTDLLEQVWPFIDPKRT